MGTRLGSGTRIVVVDGPDAIASLDLAAAASWRVLVTADGEPCAVVDLPRMGQGSEGAAAAALLPHIELHRAERRLRAALRGRLGAPEPRTVELRTSVVICTRGRPHLLQLLMESAGRLDPAPAEVIVVDNDPGGNACRLEAERFGARYVTERRRGLNNARRTGVLAATGDVVALTDDDCVLQPGWLRSIPERFADPMVAAITGPAFPHELGTEMQQLRERFAPYLQALRARRFDWTTASVIRTTDVGFGANMILRRSVLGELGELFPPELDAGTITRSGGDLYALHRILAGGYRVWFDPAAFILHRHGESGESVEQTVESWGMGFSAFLARAVVRDGELGALPYATLPVRLYVDAMLDALQGTGDRATLRMRWLYLRTALGGPRAWRRARGHAYRGRANRGVMDVPNETADDPLVLPQPAARSVASPSAGPVLSVVVPAEDGGSIRPRVCRMARGQSLAEPWEAIVVGPPPGGASEPDREPDSGRASIRSIGADGGWAERANAGAAAAGGGIVLFLDQDMEWRPDLLAAHVRAHETAGSESAVVGYSPARPPGAGLAGLASRLRSEDGFRMTAEAAGRTFTDVRATNLSMTRATLERVGGFDAHAPAGRVGWEWGVRALRAGIAVVYAPDAAAPNRRSITTASDLEASFEEGLGDAVIAARHPEVAPCLPRPGAPRSTFGRSSQALAGYLLRTRPSRHLATRLLDVLERARLRGIWLWLATAARRGAYEEAWRSSAAIAGCGRSECSSVVDLDSSEPVPPPDVAAPRVVELRLRGRLLARATPPAGHWHPDGFDDALEETGSLRAAAATLADGPDSPGKLAGAEVILGPARRPRDERSLQEFEDLGAVATTIGASAARRDGRRWRDHWSALDRALRRPGPDVVGLTVPGVRPEPRWLEAASSGLDAEGLAAVIGAGLADHHVAAGPLELLAADHVGLPYEHDARPAEYIVVRRALYEHLGGFDPDAAVAGPLGPLLDYAQRALEAGYLVGYRETPGLAAGERDGFPLIRVRWWRAQARGGLLARRALELGGLGGAAWFVRQALFPRARWLGRAVATPEHGVIRWLASFAAFLTGCARVRLSR